ncbi:AcrR family transcriptional regulator [Pseudochelatococcus lubricantis]|uniref:AcrR family transcriptional regulator n=1 Tax=Pseudochelatococcus lubricantis TaxID=1538102 RepID=A0ABX0UZZ7_9HYPH|nr:TetR/AcrR family transcriptional regulator [Pseudochelatococcus lubricantis]NIJ57545.1 AcrR family transcriptional regulator [Pseudochelatococcus lubricantis]
MARSRKIEEDDVLDAAERVIVRLGAAGLSIDAVAREAGISKARVVYTHKSKRALLEALIDRRLKAEKLRTREIVEVSRDTPHPELFGRIAAAAEFPRHEDRAIMLAISASLSSEEKLQNLMREWTMEDLEAMESGSRPRAALMAYLALTGFYCIEHFDFNRWDAAERLRILEDIRTIFMSFREPG